MGTVAPVGVQVPVSKGKMRRLACETAVGAGSIADQASQANCCGFPEMRMMNGIRAGRTVSDLTGKASGAMFKVFRSRFSNQSVRILTEIGQKRERAKKSGR